MKRHKLGHHRPEQRTVNQGLSGPVAKSAPESGFTIIELIMVIVILGILLSQTVLNMNGITPEYRLRSAARQVGSTINWARSLAGGAGNEYQLYYNLDDGKYWIVLPPGKDDDPRMLPEERERMSDQNIPEAVQIERIIRLDGSSITDGEIYIKFDPLGTEGSHIVYLRNSEGGLITLKYNSLLGVVDYYNTEIEFESF